MKLFTRADGDTTRQTWQLFRRELLHDKREAFLIFTLIPINHFLRFVGQPLLISFLLQSLLVYPQDMRTPLILLGATAVAMIVSSICNDKGYTLLYNHEEYAQTRLLKRATDHLMSQSYQFFTEHKVGSLAGDLMNFSRSYMTVLDTYFMNANHLIITFVSSLVVVAFIAPVLLVPLAAILALIVVLSIGSLQARAVQRIERKRLTSELTGSIADIFGNQLLVRIFASEKREMQTIARERSKIEKLSLEEIEIVERESRKRQVAVYSFQLITLGIFIWLFSHNRLSIAGLIFTYTYLSRTTDAMFGMASIIRTFEQAFLDAAPMTKLLAQPHTVVDAPHAPDLIVKTGSIDIQDARFSYGDATDAVFSDLNLHIAPGERVGLAGPSGGGKSTLTKLLLRFADLEKGSIRIDDQDIANVTQHSLRSHIAYVPQEPFLFHRSLRDNIAYGCDEATDDKIVDAARRAHALEFIETMPKGFDTIVGERGVKLSGGQRQRIAIARAILKDAPILILDEATSALDSESEHYIQASLEYLMKNRTVIVIAHRLSTIAKLDRIVVLKQGNVVEDGSHEKLIKAGGTYAKLWARQSGGFIDD